MGLLDDAIREHMELKRLRGGDPTLIARQEQDALGPVLHEQDAAAHEDEDAAPHSGNAAAHVENAVPQAPEGDIANPEDLAPADATLSSPADGSLSHEDDASPVSADGAPQADDAAEPQQSDHDPDFANVGQETAELDMRTVLDEQHEAADRAGQIDSAGLAVAPYESGGPVEDVLEETPDFLRETPEQERLWFEQQPPRDFDFDK